MISLRELAAQVAAQVPGYDPHHLRIEHAQRFLEQLVTPLTDTETLALPQALGRVLAHDVLAPQHQPPHDCAAMDGYALSSTDIVPGQPLVLRVQGTLRAGATWSTPVAAGACLKIMTGAAMPQGLDTVVPHELTQRSADPAYITVAAESLCPGAHCRRQGEDLRQGSVVLAQGTRLGPAALGLLAGLGLPQITVLRRLRVAYCSTGDEILSLGEPARAGAVYDSNRYTALGLLTQLGVQTLDLGVVRDDPAALEAALRTAAEQADVLITSGGVSTGEADYTEAVMQRLGEVLYWQLAQRPGRPMAVGRLQRREPLRSSSRPEIQEKSASSPYKSWAVSYQNNSSILFGLPGNPVAFMVSFWLLVRPALLRAMGCRAEPLPLLQATCTDALRKRPGRTEYQRGRLSTAADGTLQVCSTGPQSSAALSSMAQAHCLIVLPHDSGPVAAGDRVQVLLLEGAH